MGAGVTDRTWTVNMPATPGDYEFRLFSNYGYVQLAVSPAVAVVAAPPPDLSGITLTLDTTTAAPGDFVRYELTLENASATGVASVAAVTTGGHRRPSMAAISYSSRDIRRRVFIRGPFSKGD